MNRLLTTRSFVGLVALSLVLSFSVSAFASRYHQRGRVASFYRSGGSSATYPRATSHPQPMLKDGFKSYPGH